MDAPNVNLAALDAKILAADRGDDGTPATDRALGADAPGGSLVADESALWIDAAIHYGGVARAMLPERARPHWTDERLRAVGVELARCAKHYGWKFGALLTHPAATLAAAAFPLVWPIVEPHVMPFLKGALQPKEKAIDSGDAPAATKPGKVQPIDG